jgi:NAD(P)-dependent dehydrogenase (short-subunit alcohol dehydrogenase family)
MRRWAASDIPDLSGRIAVVTGATSGIGFEAALVLAGKGAETVLAVRDAGRGAASAAQIRQRHPGANVKVMALDLASLDSVAAFAETASRMLARVDILLNNAGLGFQPARGVTKDGFERQFGTNHLGHFALTGRLIPLLLQAEAPRVVTIASLAHRRGRINFADLQAMRAYRGGRVYAQSKLSNLLFARELDRRARGAGSRLVSVAAHPGLSTTGFIAASEMPGWEQWIGGAALRILGQDAAHGALPGLYAAAMPDVLGGQYWGPDGVREMKGAPALAKISSHAEDQAVWARLWAVSEALTGVTFPPLG